MTEDVTPPIACRRHSPANRRRHRRRSAVIDADRTVISTAARSLQPVPLVARPTAERARPRARRRSSSTTFVSKSSSAAAAWAPCFAAVDTELASHRRREGARDASQPSDDESHAPLPDRSPVGRPARSSQHRPRPLRRRRPRPPLHRLRIHRRHERPRPGVRERPVAAGRRAQLHAANRRRARCTPGSATSSTATSSPRTS